MQTVTLWLTAITKYIEKRKQKQRKITKPETKQVELGDRSDNSEKKRAIAGSRVNIGINNGSENNCKNKPNKPNNNRNKVDPNL